MSMIWKYFEDTSKAHCPSREIAGQIATWTDCKLSSIYYYPDGHREQDVIFPTKLQNRVRKLIRSQTPN